MGIILCSIGIQDDHRSTKELKEVKGEEKEEEIIKVHFRINIYIYRKSWKRKSTINQIGQHEVNKTDQGRTVFI